MPMTIFAGDGFHFRVRDGRVLLLWPSPGVPGEPFSIELDAGLDSVGPAYGAAAGDSAS